MYDSQAGFAEFVDDWYFDYDISRPGGKQAALLQHHFLVVGGDFHAQRSISQHPRESPRAFFQIRNPILEHNGGVSRDTIHDTLLKPMLDLLVVRGIYEQLHTDLPLDLIAIKQLATLVRI